MQDATLINEDQSAAGEVRTVNMTALTHGVELCERSSGPDTELVYGDPAHTQVLILGEEAEDVLIRALGGDSLADGLRRAFANGGLMFLSDVQDLLDRAGALYAYGAYGPDGGAYRPYYD